MSHSIMYQAFMLYDREKDNFPLKVSVRKLTMKESNNEQQQLLSQVRSFPQKPDKEYQTYQTTNGIWLCCQGKKDPNGYFCLQAQQNYPDESKQLLSQIVQEVEANPQPYLKLSAGSLQAHSSTKVIDLLNAEEDDYWKRHGQEKQIQPTQQQQSKQPEQQHPQSAIVQPPQAMKNSSQLQPGGVHTIQYKAFMLYDRSKDGFPIKLWYQTEPMKVQNTEFETLHGQVRSFPTASTQQFQWHKTNLGSWICSSGFNVKDAYYCLLAQKNYPEESEDLLGRIINEIEKDPNYMKFPNDLQRRYANKINDFVQAEEDNYQKIHGSDAVHLSPGGGYKRSEKRSQSGSRSNSKIVMLPQPQQQIKKESKPAPTKLEKVDTQLQTQPADMVNKNQNQPVYSQNRAGIQDIINKQMEPNIKDIKYLQILAVLGIAGSAFLIF